MDQIEEITRRAVLCALFGACAMLGAKAADWLIPDPPRPILRIAQATHPAQLAHHYTKQDHG